ncbi:MAG: ABC-type Fe3+-hydroxamate transport system substrate-binding protein [Parvicellaceae bacterium]|jgi:ABC-type Fe3+-hydroxamate transport system substrate-binding protein
MKNPRIVEDMLNREINIPFKPLRIISTVPSLTELLFDLGLDNRVVGITKFCIHPKSWFESKTRIGGTKNLNIDKIRTLNPDLIIANREENERSDIELLTKEFPTWISDISNLTEALTAIGSIGEICNVKLEADQLIHDIELEASQISSAIKSKRVAYAIWKDPYMFAGQSTFINDLLSRIGLENAIEDDRYPEHSLKDLQLLDLDYLFLSSEPYPFNETHVSAIKAEFPYTNVQLVDGEMFSWYGSRLKLAFGYFASLSV